VQTESYTNKLHEALRLLEVLAAWHPKFESNKCNQVEGPGLIAQKFCNHFKKSHSEWCT